MAEKPWTSKWPVQKQQQPNTRGVAAGFNGFGTIRQGRICSLSREGLLVFRPARQEVRIDLSATGAYGQSLGW